MYRVLSIDDEVVVLANSDGQVKRINRSSFNFDPRLGDRVDLFFDDYDDVIATRAKLVEDGASSRGVRSALLQGIFDLFTEVLSIHNDQVGNLKKIISQLFIAFFMSWALIGVVIVEVIIFIESVILLAYQAFLVVVRSLFAWISRRLDSHDNKPSEDHSYPNRSYDAGYDRDDEDNYIVDLDALELSADDRDHMSDDY